MKSSSLSPQTFRSSFLALVALALPCTANATLLVGWHDFDGTANPSQAGVSYASGFSGLLDHSTTASSSTGGSPDGTYGNLPSPTVPTGDGHARFGPTGSLSFTVLNSSAESVTLQSLLFDSNANTGNLQQFEISYKIGAGLTQTLATVNPPQGSGNTNFINYAFSLMGNLGSGETLTVFMNRLTNINGGAAASNIRIDNIAISAISAIPEPASLLALGCVLGSGLMLRNRRIKPIQA